jgi:hypothetical protein
MNIPFILEKFIGDFAKIEQKAISFDVSAVCLRLHATIQLSLDGVSLKLVFEQFLKPCRVKSTFIKM